MKVTVTIDLNDADREAIAAYRHRVGWPQTFAMATREECIEFIEDEVYSKVSIAHLDYENLVKRSWVKEVFE
jgi:hypothetical protein